MLKAEYSRGNWRNVIFFLSTLLIVFFDQFSKIWIRSNLGVGRSLPETGFFRLTHVRNTGVAFGLFQDQSFLLTVAAFTGIGVVLLFVFLFPRYLPFLTAKKSKLALGLVIGGTIGNLLDRLRFGYVTDFMDVSIWPVFNVADASITVGAILLAYFFFSSTKDGDY
ncbi:MAG: signal peptidase II [Dehalococcoidales bacterium]|nr:signal peptidase II [Dehalococcoidales bacterium]